MEFEWGRVGQLAGIDKPEHGSGPLGIGLCLHVVKHWLHPGYMPHFTTWLQARDGGQNGPSINPCGCLQCRDFHPTPISH